MPGGPALVGLLWPLVGGDSSDSGGDDPAQITSYRADLSVASDGTLHAVETVTTVFDVLAVAENYADLKASTNSLQLQDQLADTENKRSFARQYYNDAVATLNKLVVTLPWMLFAGVASVAKREFYQAPAGQQAPPSVTF